jgi:alanine-synthesizing transaminase
VSLDKPFRAVNLSSPSFLAKHRHPCQSSHLQPYSSRLSWSLLPNPLSNLLEKQRRLGIPLLDLTISNPTEAFPHYPHGRMTQAYAGIADFTYRPDPFGHEQARTTIAAWYQHRGIDISPNQLALTASTSEAYSLLFKLLCDPGDEILIPIPSYPLFEYLARLESVKTVPYRLLYDGSWFIDFASMRAAISTRTKAIVIVNPNNPTGSFLKIQECAALFEIANQHRLPVISDEVFMDYAFNHPSNDLPSNDLTRTLIGRDNTLSFSLNGLSKAAGMPQVKLGWIAINGPAAARSEARARLELILDTYLSVGTPVQSALGSLLEAGAEIQRQIAARITQNRAALIAALQGSPVHILHAEGGWSAILQLPNICKEEIWAARLLSEQQVLVQPGYFFDMAAEAYIIVSLITTPDVFAEGIKRLRLLAEC